MNVRRERGVGATAILADSQGLEPHEMLGAKRGLEVVTKDGATTIGARNDMVLVEVHVAMMIGVRKTSVNASETGHLH